jgi:aminomethyltransferase
MFSTIPTNQACVNVRTLNSNGFPKGKAGTKYKVHLPAKYSDTPGTLVDAVVVDMPFTESYNANTREVVKG